jgi:hypothetical protein
MTLATHPETFWKGKLEIQTSKNIENKIKIVPANSGRTPTPGWMIKKNRKRRPMRIYCVTGFVFTFSWWTFLAYRQSSSISYSDLYFSFYRQCLRFSIDFLFLFETNVSLTIFQGTYLGSLTGSLKIYVNDNDMARVSKPKLYERYLYDHPGAR